MNIDNGDFVLYLNEKNKIKYGKVINIKKQTVQAEHLEGEVDIAEEFVANLGNKPFIGSAYGNYIEPMIGSEVFENIKILKYLKVDKKDKKSFKNNILKVLKLFNKYEINNILNLVIEMRHAKGSREGSFKKGKEYDTIVISPQDWSDTLHVISHEFAHLLWTRISNKHKSKWITLFEDNITVTKLTSKQLATWLRTLKNNDTTIKAFKRELEEDDKEVFDTIIREIKLLYSLSNEDLETLLDTDMIDSYWPTDITKFSKFQIDFSKYASKSPEEYFCEVFAYNLSNPKLLPKALKSKLKKTLKKVG